MKRPGQFGSSKPPAGDAEPGTLDCAAFEQWLAESVEGGLPEATMAQLRAHAAGCAGCEEKLAQARRGREWLLVLKQEQIEIPAGMAARILARTSLAGAPGSAEILAAASRHAASSAIASGIQDAGRRAETFVPAYVSEAATMRDEAERGGTEAAKAAHKTVRSVRSASPVPAWQRNTVVVLRRTLVDPRLAMVAAMAFFSITLTLNLVGVRLTNLHAVDLAPSSMRRAATRQYAEVNARMARYYENLRIVYEVEARVQQLRRAAETSAPQQRESRPRKRSSNSAGDAGSGEAQAHREGLVTKHAAHMPAIPDPEPVRTGPRMDAALCLPGKLSKSPFDSPLARSGQAVGHPHFLVGSKLVYFSRRSVSAPERRFA